MWRFYILVVSWCLAGSQGIVLDDPCMNATCALNEQCMPMPAVNCFAPPCVATYKCMETSRPGSCPASTPEFHPDYGMCMDHCVNDVDCPRQEKCCRSACGGRVCVGAAEKAGQCPSMETSFIGLCVAQCRSDTDCRGTKKCCGGCPRVCVEPVDPRKICDSISCPPGYGCHLAPVICRSSPCYPLASCLIIKKQGGGVCPVKPEPLSKTCLKECTVDGQCSRDEICCQIGCHRVCRAPRVAVPKRGKCPKPENNSILPSTGAMCAAECSVDHDCTESMKCCGKCGMCVKPATASKIGRCPDDPFTVFPMLGIKLRCKGRQFCSSDNDCSGLKKCCGVCPRRCRTPVGASVAKAARCPAIVHVVNCMTSRVKKCSTSADCKSTSMCCQSVTCGKVCIRVIRTHRTWWLG